MPRDYLFVHIDDSSRELYAAILLDKTQNSAATFLKQVIEECPYTIECTYSDNGTEYKRTLDLLLLPFAKPIVLLKNLREFGIPKLMERLNA